MAASSNKPPTVQIMDKKHRFLCTPSSISNILETTFMVKNIDKHKWLYPSNRAIYTLFYTYSCFPGICYQESIKNRNANVCINFAKNKYGSKHT